MINISDIVLDPDFAQPSGFIVTRTYGDWVSGTFTVTSTEELNYSGVIEPSPNTKDMMQVPEADRIQGIIVVWSTSPLNTSTLTNQYTDEPSITDEITWNGEQWKILQVRNFSDFGYYRAIATRKLAS